MRNTYITDSARLVERLARFTSFVQHMDGHSGFISFRDNRGFLGHEEDYKTEIAEKAREQLNSASWDESLIGTGKIAECAKVAMSKAGNLVNKNQQIDFRNRLSQDHPKYQPGAERVLYDLYCNPLCDEASAFENAVAVFGKKYDTISFLFFIKDDSRFLPISPSHFDKGFKDLNIAYTMSYQCSWENYQGFIEIIKEIRTVMEDLLPMQGIPRLIDAHSFVWVCQENRFTHWQPDAVQDIQIEQITEEYVQGVVSA